MATTTTTSQLALCVQVEETHGTYKAVARVVIVQPNGELHNPSWRGNGHNFEGTSDDGQRYDGLQVSAYAGNLSYSSYASDTDQKLWGFGVHYAPYRIENATHAKAIAKVFAQVERNMATLESEDGYIPDGDFARYVMRVAKALRIRQVYARVTPRAYAMTGERYRIVDAPSLGYWCNEVTERIVSGELSTLVR